jgi:hypothetical protein
MVFIWYSQEFLVPGSFPHSWFWFIVISRQTPCIPNALAMQQWRYSLQELNLLS